MHSEFKNALMAYITGCHYNSKLFLGVKRLCDDKIYPIKSYGEREFFYIAAAFSESPLRLLCSYDKSENCYSIYNLTDNSLIMKLNIREKSIINFTDLTDVIFGENNIIVSAPNKEISFQVLERV